MKYFQVFVLGSKYLHIRYFLILITIFNISSVLLCTDALANLATKADTTDSTIPKIKFSKITESEKKQKTQELDKEAQEKTQIENITVNEIGEISEKFVQALQDKNTRQFYEYLDIPAIVRNSLMGAIQKLDDLSEERDNVIRGIIAIPDILISKIGVNGHIKYLHLVKRNESYRGLVRIKFNNGELSYLELITHKDKNGKTKIIDYYDSMLGRNYTTIVSQMLINSGNKSKTSDKIKIYSTERLTFQDRYAQTIRFYQKGEYKKSIDSFQHLPAKFKATRDILLLRTQIAKATNRIAYREALVLLEKEYLNAPDLGLLLSDHYFFTKQYSKALKTITNFSEYIGGDIALDSLRLKIFLKQNHYKQAIEVGADAIKEDPSYEDIYWLMLKAYLHSYQYQQVGEILDVLLDKFNAQFEIENFYKDPFYREYGFSKQFKKWKEQRASKSD
ncbi:MAG: tetratricopeptide repeat protein [Gammaproteobacteria bacterium]